MRGWRWSGVACRAVILSVLIGVGATCTVAHIEGDADASVDANVRDGGADAGADTGADATDPCANACVNGVADCGETDVDCGGPCAACAEVVVWPDPNAELPSVAATGDKVVVAWNVTEPGLSSGVYYRCHDAQGWADVAVLDIGPSFCRAPKVEADGQGRIHLVATHGAGDAIRYAVFSNASTCAGSTWSAVEDVTAGPPGGRYASVAVDDNDDPHVCWHDAAYTNVYYNTAPAGVWGVPVQVTDTQWDSRHPDITVSAGVPHIAFEQDDEFFSNTHPHYTYGTGAVFSTPFELAASNHSWPQIVADSVGDLHVIFTTRIGDEVRYWRQTGGGWSAPLALNTNPTDWSRSGLAIDDLGALHATWHQGEGGTEQVYYRIGEASTGTWPEAGRRVSTDSAQFNLAPAIAVDPARRAHIVWIRNLGGDTGAILYRRVAFDDL